MIIDQRIKILSSVDFLLLFRLIHLRRGRWEWGGGDYGFKLRVLGSVLWLLLESELVAVPALSLAAVGGLEGEGGVAFPANFLVAVEFLGDGCDGGIHHTSSQPEDQVKGGLLLDVVVGKTSAIFMQKEIPSSCLPAKMSLC